MKCIMCGNDRMKTHRENHAMDVGLDSPVTIVEAEVNKCADCGETEVVIENLEEFNRSIAHAVAMKPPRLTSKEVRFLRTYLGYSSQDFAEAMGVDAGSVSRWEKDSGEYPMALPAERLLRLMVLHEAPKRDYPLAEMGTVAAKPMRLKARQKNHEWSVGAA